MDFFQQIENYRPVNEQETADMAAIRNLRKQFANFLLTRENTVAHLTASGFIVNETCTKTLMIHHNIYDSWGWTGGHADGDANLRRVALKEASEETGISRLRPLSEEIAAIDLLPVRGHVKRGRYVSAHLHITATYILIADESQKPRSNPEENSGARWLPLAEIGAYCSETHMLPVYAKLTKKARELHAKRQHQ